jgi:hypothetical protein
LQLTIRSKLAGQEEADGGLTGAGYRDRFFAFILFFVIWFKLVRWS